MLENEDNGNDLNDNTCKNQKNDLNNRRLISRIALKREKASWKGDILLKVGKVDDLNDALLLPLGDCSFMKNLHQLPSKRADWGGIVVETSWKVAIDQ